MRADKIKISEALFKSLKRFDPISVTIVGSITVSDDISVVSDIDTVVIVNKLNKSLFNDICAIVSQIETEELGLYGFNLKVNSTFGPLKFDEENTAVIHLMVYDVEGHKDHVLKSPFTCYDWERSDLFYGKSLREIYPVIGLQPYDFIKARRGLANYIDDLKEGCISYRKYSEENGKLIQKVLELKVDSKHRGEFAYHIVRNLIFNYIKMLRKENVLYSDEKFYEYWSKYCHELSYFIEDFKELKFLKSTRAENYPNDIISKVQEFVNKFTEMIGRKLDTSCSLNLIRHAKTECNDGTFLGQRRDPGIIDCHIEQIVKEGQVFSSPLKRALETCVKYFPKAKVDIDNRLMEIDYGDAEGLTYGELKKECAYLVNSWANLKDTKFPNGENSQEVLDRFLEFVTSKAFAKTNHIVSHNVLIRNALGYSLGLARYTWFTLPIEHLEIIKLIKYEGYIFADLDPIQKEKFSESLRKVINA